MKNPTEQRADERGADSGAASGSATWNFSAGGHPEAVCQDCSGPNVMWWAANDVWNKVIRPNGEITADPMICPRCFIIRAKRLGLYGPWCVTHGSTESSPNERNAAALPAPFSQKEWHDISLCIGWTVAMSEGKDEPSVNRRATSIRAMAALRRVLGEGFHARIVSEQPNAELTHCAKKP